MYTQGLRKVCAEFTQCLCNVYAMFTHGLRNVYAMFTQGLRVVYAKVTQDIWIYRGWLVQRCSGRDPLVVWLVQRCSGRDPLVVLPAEGATRRSVAVSRDRPAPQPLREQEQIRAAQRPSQKVQLGPSQSVDWITHVRRRVVCQTVSLRKRISGTPQP